MKTFTVSVCMITYGHESYIRESLNGILMQKVDFPVEVVVADDCSPDKTEDIVHDLIRSHPNGHWIKYTRHAQNKGMMNNFIWALQQCKGKYVAYCEGDDYWTDEAKLQKQVDFLEENPGFSFCFHRVVELFPDGKRILSHKNFDTDQTFTINDLAKRNDIHTLTVLFRNHLIPSFPSWLPEAPFGDYVLHLLNARHGHYRYFAAPMGVYRKHATGNWTSHTMKENYGRLIILLDFLLQEDFEESVQAELKKHRRKRIISYLKIVQKEDEQQLQKSLQEFAKTDNLLEQEWLSLQQPKSTYRAASSFKRLVRALLWRFRGK
jgi:glycosyltransferase involved in cell wall biosynthesis